MERAVEGVARGDLSTQALCRFPMHFEVDLARRSKFHATTVNACWFASSANHTIQAEFPKSSSSASHPPLSSTTLHHLSSPCNGVNGLASGTSSLQKSNDSPTDLQNMPSAMAANPKFRRRACSQTANASPAKTGSG